MIVYILTVLETILFILTFITVCYLLIFAIAGSMKYIDPFSKSNKKKRFLIIFPAYREDSVIERSVISILEQKYPKELFDTAVVADNMLPETIERLRRMPIYVFDAHFTNSSKANALNFAIEQISASNKEYDMVVVLDADNTVENNFLTEINRATVGGATAIQAHRIAKNMDTDTAILDAVSEEINNTIFRAGHVRLGFSSALIGSGMAINYKWFKNNIQAISSMGEDKELESLLIFDRIFIEYLPHVYVYDEKTKKRKAFSRQRRRWLSAQFEALGRGLYRLPSAILQGNLDYCDKLFQWMMPPRAVLVIFTTGMAFLVTLSDWLLGVKWWITLLMLLGALCAAIPDYLIDDKFRKAMRKTPILGFIMIYNLFKLKGANRKFIHTPHGDNA